MHIQISENANFQFKPTIFIFWAKFSQKEYFQSKSEKMNTTIEFWIFKSVYIPNFRLNWQFSIFWTNLPKNYFPSKNEKGNITTEFCVYELAKVPNFRLNWQFWYFRPNLHQKSIWSKLEKSERLINSAYFKLLGDKLQLQG